MYDVEEIREVDREMKGCVIAWWEFCVLWTVLYLETGSWIG